MGLATPIALWSAFSALAARGIVVFKGESIERLAAVDCLYFDKTGTLTEEQYSLIDLTTSGTSQERSRLISDLALVQSHSAHPIARAFHSLDSGSVNGRVVGKLKTHPGMGIEATISSNGEVIRKLRIGRLELMESTEGISELTERSRRCEGDQCLYVQSNGRLKALAVIRERVRQSAQTAVTALHDQGIEVGVLTGDRIERCIETEFPGVQAGLRPEDKVRIIQQQRDKGHSVAFVGDGVNDSPAVASADVGIVLAHGADITSSHADIILYGNDLTRIPWAITLSRKVLQSIRSNFRFAAFYNGIGIVLAACGLLHPIVAALLMVGSSAVFSWRASNSCAGLDTCCGVTPENSDKAGNEKKEQRETHQWGTGLGIAFAGQGPLVIYLGNLSGVESTMILLSFMFIGMLLIRFGHQWYRTGRNTGMILRMLAYGNWGMLVGWWMDAGLGQVMADGVCLCCQSRHYFNMESFDVPWMVVGMLGFGLPGMLLDPRIAPKLWDKIVQGVLSSIGMIWGMFTGADLVLNLAGPLHPHQFLFAFAGMITGMLIGMVFFCELGRRLLNLSKPLMKVASS
jgi:soluble P-type ATPase